MAKSAAARAERARGRGEIQRPGWGSFQLYGDYPTDPERAPRGYEETDDYRVVESALDHSAEARRGATSRGASSSARSARTTPTSSPSSSPGCTIPKKVPLPPSFADTLEDKPRDLPAQSAGSTRSQLSDDEVRESIAHYWAYCSMEDALFGLVLDALDATGQAEDTLVLRVSDHGDYCGAHGLWAKGVASFREGYHIPFAIVRWPAGIVNPGRVVDEFVTLADFAPTFLDVAGVPTPYRLARREPAPVPRGRGARQTGPDAFFTPVQRRRAVLQPARRSRLASTSTSTTASTSTSCTTSRVDPHETTNLADGRSTTRSSATSSAECGSSATERATRCIFNPYVTVALAPYGPADALGE